MVTSKPALHRITDDRRGVTAVEYAIIATFMAGVLVATVPGLAKVVGASFTPAATHISTGK